MASIRPQALLANAIHSHSRTIRSFQSKLLDRTLPSLFLPASSRAVSISTPRPQPFTLTTIRKLSSSLTHKGSAPTTSDIVAMPLDKSKYISHIFKDDIFANKVVFVTGGAGSICSAQTRALVSLGCNAFIIGRNPEKTTTMAKSISESRPGSRVIGKGNVDVRSIESLQSAVDACIQELGRIDFCIAGAAGNFLAPISQLSSNAFKTVIDIDLIGSYNTAKACLPHLVKAAKEHTTGESTSPSGRILFVSATLHYSGTPLQTHAAAAKAGVDALSTQICIEYGPLGLTSNVIAPGPIAGTEGMDRLAKKQKEGENRFKTIPSGRMGCVKDIADATVYLFSDAANYVNGEVLVVDGGAWRMSGGPGMDFKYPDFLIEGGVVDGVGGMKKEKKGGSKL